MFRVLAPVVITASAEPGPALGVGLRDAALAARVIPMARLRREAARAASPRSVRF